MFFLTFLQNLANKPFNFSNRLQNVHEVFAISQSEPGRCALKFQKSHIFCAESFASVEKFQVSLP